MSALRGAPIAASAALLWIALGVESILRPYPVHARDAAWYAPFLVTTVTLALVHRAQAGRASLFERAGYCAVIASCVLVMAGNIGVLWEIPALALFAFPWGALLWTAAMIPFGIGTVRARVFPPYVGIAIAALEPGSLLTGLALSPIAPLHNRGAYSAGVEKGLVLALISLGFHSLSRLPRGEEGRRT